MNTYVTPLPHVRAGGAHTSVASAAGRRLARLGASVWRAMQESGRARARSELLTLADACERNQPNLARELRAAAAHDPLA